ncbi:MAG: DinB family protein [Actinobacteria bacterium]|nr:DinB family protein [Actinomycetota bacterium]
MLDVEDNEFCFILRKNRAPEDRVIDNVGRPEPPVGSGEIEMLLGFLDYQRSTLEWKTRGLDASGLAQRVSPSSMTLGGILKHLAWVEDHWFSYFLFNVDRSEPWRSVDWSADQNWEWNSASSDSPEDLRALWSLACERSRENVRSVISAGLGQRAVRTWPNGESPSLRWIIVHMIEEYARHNGHADYLRESVDGETGE